MAQLGRLVGVARTHAHRYRHTFATWAIETGARELDVQYPARPQLVGDGAPLLGDVQCGEDSSDLCELEPGDLLGSSLPSDGQRSAGQSTEIMAGQQSAKAEQIAQSI